MINEGLNNKNIQIRIKWIRISFFIGIILFFIKLTGYLITNSVAILSDALESIINIIASGFAFYSIRLSAMPADKSHPYGHGKIEFFSAGFEGALIILAAFGIFYTAIPGFFSNIKVTSLNKGIILVLISAFVNLILGIYLKKRGKEAKSFALESDGRHILTDSFSSFAVILALFLVYLTNYIILDPIIACAVAFNILFSGVKIVKTSYARLMDEADPLLLQNITNTFNSGRKNEWIDVHHLRAWVSGAYHHIDIHLTLPRFWELDKSHDTEKDIERMLLENLEEEGEVIVHIDPCSPSCCIFCPYEPCPVRENKFKSKNIWTKESLISEPSYLK